MDRKKISFFIGAFPVTGALINRNRCPGYSGHSGESRHVLYGYEKTEKAAEREGL